MSKAEAELYEVLKDGMQAAGIGVIPNAMLSIVVERLKRGMFLILPGEVVDIVEADYDGSDPYNPSYTVWLDTDDEEE